MEDTQNVSPEKEYEAAKALFESETYQKQLVATVNALVRTKPKAVGRVLRKLVLEPIDQLHNNEIPLLTKEEKELYNFCKQIMYAKSVVIKTQLGKLVKEQGETNEEAKTEMG